MEILRRIEIPLYLRRVRLVERRRATYYELGKKPPTAKKYHNTKHYIYKPQTINGELKVVLMEVATGRLVVKNSLSVGTPRDKLINGQDIYNQTIMMEQRNKMLQAIKTSFAPFVNGIKPIDITDLPIRIDVELHDTIKEESSGQLWDVDNRFYMYGKAFQDVLTGNRLKGIPRGTVVIPDDNNLIISRPPSPLFIPVSSSEQRKLVFIIYKESDPRILNNVERQKLFNILYPTKK